MTYPSEEQPHGPYPPGLDQPSAVPYQVSGPPQPVYYQPPPVVPMVVPAVMVERRGMSTGAIFALVIVVLTFVVPLLCCVGLFAISTFGPDPSPTPSP